MDTARRWFIYVLCDPRNGEPRYVGKTVDPKRRLYRHRTETIVSHVRTGRWIRSLRSDRVTPAMTIIDAGRGDGHGAAERAWIAELRRRGHDLTNTAAGGHGGNGPCSPEAREKLRASNLGQTRSPETCARISAGKTGAKQPREAVLRRAAAMMGHAVSETTRALIGATKRGIPRTVETKAKIAATLTGRPLSEATKAKLRLAQTARRERERLERTNGVEREGPHDQG